MPERAVPYDRQTVNNPNPLVRYAHRSRMALSLSLSTRHLPRGGTFVDFGAGTGLLLHRLHAAHPDLELIGIEPFRQPAFPGAGRYVADLAEVGPARADIIGAFEVCEHMYEHELRRFLRQCQHVLRPRGRLLVSVPIMYGAGLLPKILNRMLLYRGNNTGYRLRDIFWSTFGIPVARPDNPRHTHAGFDFRWLLRLLDDAFAIERVIYSPFAALPWFVNSQVFIVCAKRPDGA